MAVFIRKSKKALNCQIAMYQIPAYVLCYCTFAKLTWTANSCRLCWRRASLIVSRNCCVVVYLLFLTRPFVPCVSRTHVSRTVLATGRVCCSCVVKNVRWPCACMHVYFYKLFQYFEGNSFRVLIYHPSKTYLNLLNPSGYFIHNQV
jgi:hypothetical protein